MSNKVCVAASNVELASVRWRMLSNKVDVATSNLNLASVDNDAMAIVDERDPVYGKAWQKMKIEHIMFEIHQKADRIMFMPDGPEKYNQALDLINYGRFLAWRLKQRMSKQ